MERSRIERIGYVAAFSLVLLVNYLANAIPLGGQTTGEISDKFFSTFTPAGFTFAIWGIIYLALLAFIVRQALPRHVSTNTLSRIWPFFLTNCFANAGWIAAWHFDQLVLSMLLMTVLLYTLLKINQLISSESSWGNGWDYVFIALPFHMYFGWISVATIANLSILQSAYGLNDLLIAHPLWTILKLIATGFLAYFWGWRHPRPLFVFVIAWASYGIASANSGEVLLKSAAWILAAVAFLSGILIAVRLLRTNQDNFHSRGGVSVSQ